MKSLAVALLPALFAACASSSPSDPSTPSSPSPAQPAAGRAQLKPCRVEGSTEELRCGTYSVWENRETRSGRKIELGIIVIPALSPTPAPDPVFLFAGGPGDAATNGAAGTASDRQLRASRDIVMVDQRGTGRSHRLSCQVPRDPANVQGYFEPTLPPDAMRECRAELEKNADLTQYTTSIAADDVDEVRQWLGYDKINVFGGSYGTRAAQVYMRRHGDHVRTAVLLGTAGMNQYLPLNHARDGKHALDLLFARCAADPACAKAFPDLAAEHERVLAGLDRERGRATVKSPQGGKPAPVTIPRDIFAEQIRFTMYNAATASATPYIIHRAAQGDFDPFARLTMVWEPAFRRILAWGMHLSVTCAEDVPFMTKTAIDQAIEGTYLRGYRVLQQVAACREWPRGAIPQDFHKPIVSDIPTLIISGPYDPVTPPRWAEQVLPHLARAKHVLIPEGHHGPGGLTSPECFTGMLQTFFDRGSTDGLDTSCVSAMKRPPFITDAPGFEKVMKEVGG
jgi:pimeloyl-ACP methyl ester carboxylesterase